MSKVRPLKPFEKPLLDLFIQVFNLKSELLKNDGDKKKGQKRKFDRLFKQLIEEMQNVNPDITVIISYDNTFYTNSEVFFTDYQTFCRIKTYFTLGGSPVTFIPSNFKTFKEFVEYQNH